MKTLIAVLMLSAQSLNVLVDESPRPELGTIQLAREILIQQREVSHGVLLDALTNLKPLALEKLVVEASSANASRFGS